MADSKLSDLTAASALTGTELFYSDDGSADVKVTASQLKTFAVGAGSMSVASGKTLTANNSLTLAGTDSTTMTFPSSSTTLAGLSIANLFTKANTFQPDSDAQAGTFRRNSSSQSSYILEVQTEANATLGYFDKVGGIGGNSLSLSGNISAPAWTTSGIRYKNASSTFTDTSSSGTVAAAYTNVYGGNTIAASNSTTFTDYYTTFISQPTAGTNVTFTNRWALGLSGNLNVAGTATLAGGTVTTSQPVLNLSQTWNDAAVTFTGLKFNATSTASAAGSLLLDLQVGGTSKFSVTKAGAVIGAAQSYNVPLFGASSVTGWSILSSNYTGYYVANSQVAIGINASEAMLRSTTSLSWSSGEPGVNGSDLILRRAAAASLQLGAADVDGSPVAQTLGVQSVAATTTSNNVAGANLTINGSRGSGSGAGGSIIFQVAPAGSSGTTRNAYATALTIDSTKLATFGGRVQTDMVGSSVSSNFSGILFGAAVHSYYVSNAVQLDIRLNQITIGGPLGNGSTLSSDAAHTLALRNGANAQTLRSYRSYTDASNYQRLAIAWNTSTALVMNEGAGTGADGSVAFNDAALATDATKGFIMVPSCAGTPTGTPADIPTGQIPLVWDSTNLKLYVYTGGAWKASAAFT